MNRYYYAFLMLLGTTIAGNGATNYENIIAQSDAAIDASKKVMSPWLDAFIALAPALAIIGAIIGVWMYERSKAKEERKDGTFKVVIITLVVGFLAILGLELIISMGMEYLTGDATLGTTIRQTWWKEVFAN